MGAPELAPRAGARVGVTPVTSPCLPPSQLPYNSTISTLPSCPVTWWPGQGEDN